MNAKKLLKKNNFLAKNIKGTDYENLDLLPADFSFRNFDLFKSNHWEKTKKSRIQGIFKNGLAAILNGKSIQVPPSFSFHKPNPLRYSFK